MDRILITGATGFLGGAVVRALLADGVSVVAMGRNKGALTALKDAGARVVAADLAAPFPSDISDACKGVTHIVHAAALSSPWGRPADFDAANVAGTDAVIRLGVGLSIRKLVYISTPSVYFRFADQRRLGEDMALPPPINDYARTKLLGEDLVTAMRDVPSVILRPRAIYGEGDTALLPRLMRVANTRPIPRFIGGDGATDLTHVSDVVAAIRAALDHSSETHAPVFNISGGQEISMPDIIKAVCARSDITPRFRRLPFAPVLAAARALEAMASRLPGRPEPPVTAFALGNLRYAQTLDISKAARDLGWEPKLSFEDGLDLTFGSRP
jgi:nucleoside-diphosphate-sugar epimerase